MPSEAGMDGHGRLALGSDAATRRPGDPATRRPGDAATRILTRPHT